MAVASARCRSEYQSSAGTTIKAASEGATFGSRVPQLRRVISSIKIKIADLLGSGRAADGPTQMLVGVMAKWPHAPILSTDRDGGARERPGAKQA
jgi:hypothetical protein